MAQFSSKPMHSWLQVCSIVLSSGIFCFQVGKQFDALLVDTSVPVFDTFAGDTMNVSKSYKHTSYWNFSTESLLAFPVY